MESMRNKTRTEELEPEMRAALERPRAFLSVEASLKDLDRGASLADESVLGGDDGACANVWFHRFCAFEEPLTPSAASPVRANFMSLSGRRARALALSGIQKVVLSRSDLRTAVRARERDAAVECGPSKQPRHN